MTLASLTNFEKRGRINRKYEAQVVREHIKALNIATPSIERMVKNLGEISRRLSWPNGWLLNVEC